MKFSVNNRSLFSYLKDDPVRPNISPSERMNDVHTRYVFSFVDDNNSPLSILCCSIQSEIPVNEAELFEDGFNTNWLIFSPSDMNAIFYSVWSYQKGTAGRLIFAAKEYIKTNNPDVKRFVTLSPKTKMAYDFHIKNGAFLLKENDETINYEYSY